jgi:hypothetical protein
MLFSAALDIVQRQYSKPIQQNKERFVRCTLQSLVPFPVGGTSWCSRSASWSWRNIHVAAATACDFVNVQVEESDLKGRQQEHEHTKGHSGVGWAFDRWVWCIGSEVEDDSVT